MHTEIKGKSTACADATSPQPAALVVVGMTGRVR